MEKDVSIIPDCIHKYAEHLRAYYKRCKSDPKWSPARTKLYVDLAVVENDQNHSDAFSESTLHHSFDDILRKKSPTSLEELCKISLKSLYVIEGAPGIGKSTLAFELCRRWVDKEALHHFSLLLLLCLREKAIQKLSSIEDLLGYFSWSLRQSWKQEAIQHIIDGGGEGVLIIFEGFDELPEDIATNSQSIFLELINTLPKATIIITTHPSAEQCLKQKLTFEKHIEVLGFTNDSIETYKREHFKNDELLLQKFEQCLKQFPKLRRFLHIPITLVIVLDVFSEQFLNDKHIITQSTKLTSTKLYEMLIRMLIYRHLKDKNPGRKINFSSLEELPQPEKDDFHYLCHLAYSGLVNSERQRQLVFYDQEDSLNTLGLMQKRSQVLASEGGDVIGFSFHHLTIQEFLAAYHVHLMKLPEIQDHFYKFNNNPALAMMMIFLAGLTKFRSLSLYVKKQIYSTIIFREFFEAENDDIISELFDKECFEVSRLKPLPTPQDMYMIGHCIALSKCTWELGFTLRYISSEHLGMLQSGLSSTDDKLKGQIRSAKISLNPFGNNGLNCILNFPNHILNNLCSLHLRGIDVDVDCLDGLVSALPNLSKLDEFVFHDNKFKEGEQMLFIETLHCLKSLHHVSFSRLSPDECVTLLTKSSMCTLHTIELYQLSPYSVGAVLGHLSKSTNLKNLQIRQSEVKTEFVRSLLTSLPSSHIKSLKFINCAIDSVTVCIIADAVKETPSLEKLNLSDNLIDDEGGHYLADMIQSLTITKSSNHPGIRKPHLNELYLDHNSFTKRTVLRLFDDLLSYQPQPSINLHLSSEWQEYVTSKYDRVRNYLQFGRIEKN